MENEETKMAEEVPQAPETPYVPAEQVGEPVSPQQVKKKVHVPALVLMIIGAIGSIVFPLLAYVCCIISLVFAIIRRKTHRTTATLVIDIIALVVAIANSVFGAMILSGALKLG